MKLTRSCRHRSYISIHLEVTMPTLPAIGAYDQVLRIPGSTATKGSFWASWVLSLFTLC